MIVRVIDRGIPAYSTTPYPVFRCSAISLLRYFAISLLRDDALGEDLAQHLIAGDAFVQDAKHGRSQGVSTPYFLPRATTAAVVGTPSATPLLTLVASSTLMPLPRLAPKV